MVALPLLTHPSLIIHWQNYCVGHHRHGCVSLYHQRCKGHAVFRKVATKRRLSSMSWPSWGFENEVQEVDEEEFAQAVSCPGMELFAWKIIEGSGWGNAGFTQYFPPDFQTHRIKLDVEKQIDALRHTATMTSTKSGRSQAPWWKPRNANKASENNACLGHPVERGGR